MRATRPPACGRAGAGTSTVRTLLRLTDGLAMAGVAVLLLVVAGAILARLVSDASGGAVALSLPGRIELARHALMVAVLAGLPGAAARGLVRVEILAERFPAPLAQALDRLWAVALALVAALAAWHVARAAAEQATAGEVSQVIGYPLWPLTAMAAASLGALGLVALARALGRA